MVWEQMYRDTVQCGISLYQLQCHTVVSVQLIIVVLLSRPVRDPSSRTFQSRLGGRWWGALRKELPPAVAVDLASALTCIHELKMFSEWVTPKTLFANFVFHQPQKGFLLFQVHLGSFSWKPRSKHLSSAAAQSQSVRAFITLLHLSALRNKNIYLIQSVYSLFNRSLASVRCLRSTHLYCLLV